MVLDCGLFWIEMLVAEMSSFWRQKEELHLWKIGMMEALVFEVENEKKNQENCWFQG